MFILLIYEQISESNCKLVELYELDAYEWNVYIWFVVHYLFILNYFR